jgi:hypothetical protein
MILQQFCDRGSTVEALDELNQELKRAYGWDLGIYDTLSPGQVLGHHEAAMRLLEMIASNGADAKSGAGGWDVVATPALSRENSDFAAMAQQLSQQQQQQVCLLFSTAVFLPPPSSLLPPPSSLLPPPSSLLFLGPPAGTGPAPPFLSPYLSLLSRTSGFLFNP